MTVAIVTNSGSDLTPAQLREYGIRQVPLSVTIGSRSYLSPDELAPEEFWRLMRAPDNPFAHTAAASAGQFKQVFDQAFEEGADSIVCVCLSETLSSTIQSARLAKEMLPGRQISLVDSRSASMAVGALALRAAAMAAQGSSATEITDHLMALRLQTVFFVALETLEYLRRGGRISSARAAIGGLLSVKPIMTIEDGLVVSADTPRTRAKAHDRLVSLMTESPVAELHVLFAPPADAEGFRDELLDHLPPPAPRLVTAQVIGPVIGSHVGPGAYGGVLLRQA